MILLITLYNKENDRLYLRNSFSEQVYTLTDVNNTLHKYRCGKIKSDEHIGINTINSFEGNVFKIGNDEVIAHIKLIHFRQ